MRPQALGYVGFRTGDLDEWRAYGTRHLGFQVVDRSGGSVAFRMDDRKQRVVVEGDGREAVSSFSAGRWRMRRRSMPSRRGSRGRAFACSAEPAR